MSFQDLGLSSDIMRAIEELNYTDPTPIQEKAIPYALMGRDLIGVAQTGTGKTASFTLPMIEILSGGRAKARMPRSLILTPTRELATQVAANFDQFTKYSPLTKAILIGGESMDDQLRKLDRGVDVLIATPGRLLDLFERGKILLNDIKIFVIDEADRMLDMGFIPDIERIGGLLPPLRQTLLFSATMPPEIKRLASRFLSNPKEVAVAPPATITTTVAQHVIRTTERQKRHMLRHLLRGEGFENAMVFCNRKRDVQTVADSLKRHGFDAAPLHGDLVQSVRTETLDKFRAGEIKILVCSDVAARGLDIKGVSHVLNFDVPFNAEDYVHRIGRTGRAGRSGVAFTLVTDEDQKLLDNIHSMTRQEIPLLEVTDFVPDTRPDNADMKTGRGASRGRDGKSGSGRDSRGRERDRSRGPKHNETAATAPFRAAPPAETTVPVQLEVEAVVLPQASETLVESAASAGPVEQQPQPQQRERQPRPDRQPREQRSDRPARDRPERERSGERGGDTRQRHAGREANEESVTVTGPGFGDELPAFMRGGKPKTAA